MAEDNRILIGKGDKQVHLLGQLANRHGLIAGATGTGKTVSLQVLSEGFSRMGVPVFVADVKGDLSGITQAGSEHPKVTERINTIGIEGFEFNSYPAIFWDLFKEKGHAIRATISEMGPLLLSRLLELNDTQEGVLNIAFRFADDEGLLMLDMDDLRETLKFMAENKDEFTNEYGNVSSASIGAIQRRLLVLEEQGGDQFFGEPALDLWDFLRTAERGYGQINILAADQLMNSPRLYATFLLWLLSELFETLPEIGDPEKPRMVFFFDEAHLLFDEAPKALVDKIEQVVKLIRSKGVGVYFVTQNPLDIPDGVLAQLGNRIQHALRSYTPREQKAVKAAASTFRANPNFDTNEAITQLGTGEALVSVLDEDGTPTIVEKTLICPPQSRIGPATDTERQAVISSSLFNGKYKNAIDRESASEILIERAEKIADAREQQENEEAEEKAKRRRSGGRQGIGEAFIKSMARSIGTRVAGKIVRGVLGSIFK